ncbi:MAG: hypothetical protein JXR11_02550 [Balneola sp.]
MDRTNIPDSILNSIQGLPVEQQTIVRDSFSEVTPEMLSELIILSEHEDSVDQAYITIGKNSGQGIFGIDALKEGKRLFNNHKNQLQKKLCGYDPLRVYCENAHVIDRITLAGIILGALITITSIELDVIATAHLVSRISIRDFCKSEWSNQLNA